ncbi:hypothetical protein AAHH80_41905, partial [Burkholderia pseudomallei]
KQYRADLQQIRMVVRVGHSQGPRYAKFVMILLITGRERAHGRKSSVNFGIGSLYLLQGSIYLTSSSDSVIGSLGLV